MISSPRTNSHRPSSGAAKSCSAVMGCVVTAIATAYQDAPGGVKPPAHFASRYWNRSVRIVIAGRPASRASDCRIRGPTTAKPFCGSS